MQNASVSHPRFQVFEKIKRNNTKTSLGGHARSRQVTPGHGWGVLGLHVGVSRGHARSRQVTPGHARSRVGGIGFTCGRFSGSRQVTPGHGLKPLLHCKKTCLDERMNE